MEELKIEWTKAGTTTSYIGGADWSRAAPVGGWGDANEIEIEFLVMRVQDAFHRQAGEAGSSVRWIPQSSKIIHDINEPSELAEKYNEWRFFAIEEIWNKYSADDYAELFQGYNRAELLIQKLNSKVKRNENILQDVLLSNGWTKPSYCTNNDVETCMTCDLSDFHLDCQNNPISDDDSK